MPLDDGPHALCGRAVHHLRTAGLCGKHRLRHGYLRAGLKRQERHGVAQRTRPAQRQIIRFCRRHLDLRGRAAWAHDFNPDRSIAATFQALPGASFVVNGAGPARNAALTTASAEMKWQSGFSLAANFEGEFSAVTAQLCGQGRCAVGVVRSHPVATPRSRRLFRRSNEAAVLNTPWRAHARRRKFPAWGVTCACNPMSHAPFKYMILLVQLGGLEPPTSCSTDRRSNQLSYNCILGAP